jgi:hypothetical protein
VSAVLRVHVYVDKHLLKAISTGRSRPDVAKARGSGPAPGFDALVPVTKGRHTICLFAINISTGTKNPSLGCRAVTVS